MLIQMGAGVGSAQRNGADSTQLTVVQAQCLEVRHGQDDPNLTAAQGGAQLPVASQLVPTVAAVPLNSGYPAIAQPVYNSQGVIRLQPWGGGHSRIVPISGPHLQPGASGVAVIRGVKKPPDHMVLAFISFLCCFWPTGLCAVCFACQVNTLYRSGDYAGSLQASRLAGYFSYGSIGLGILFFIAIGSTT
mmetsp:Transcript_8136/g.14365  ORF Transcript_8136/g.14365 Transcript_8136/m.14365 type:complete len:190 (+) Transcript_8136:161-730(+)|eukprot:CAMPEP_0194562652 /NCGR_PEP_ID=MMETSP0292-20121207/3021_1 /TAXON_ID=39354 /ORGANISM="Heterosigma akashiwo, Strain CCMP2393" /LENGTH=189 /DNA_ID=CAMNT_0039411423 /DNA_START=156 /DNA_END=725 /DNA_ORIENTATION=-